MPSRSHIQSMRVVPMLTPILANNDAEGTPAPAYSLRNVNAAHAYLQIGDSGDTLSGALKIDVLVEDSDDGVTFVPVTEASYIDGFHAGVRMAPDGTGIIATIDAPAEDQVLVGCGYLGGKEYFRLRPKFTGTHTAGTPISGFYLLSDLHLEGVYNTTG